ncbi:MAG: tRNA lysidine(34) synthetase TilS, partial [Clostridia bacterium]|nr:tRNA lysidine(34) synthetase TilS [Clostridia bacterium]
MLSCDNYIKENKLIKAGEIIGVGCSGGSDSIALLHYMAKAQEKLDIEVVAIHIDHQIREDSYIDAELVKNLAKELGIRFYKFRVDVPKLAKERGQGLEECAREARYGVFKSLLQKGLIDKIALAHHAEDQAETILMHLFRGAGLAGAKGMEAKSEKVYIRPMLKIGKQEIYQYIDDNRLEYREDYTNKDNSYNRNFVRNVLFPEIVKRWPNAVQAIVNFGVAVKEDDDYINKQVYDDALIYEDKT